MLAFRCTLIYLRTRGVNTAKKTHRQQCALLLEQKPLLFFVRDKSFMNFQGEEGSSEDAYATTVGMCDTSTAVGLAISLTGRSTEESGSYHARSGASLLQPISWWTLGLFQRSLLEDTRVLKRIVEMSCSTHVSQTAASDGETCCV